MIEHRPRWMRLDNAAKIFPAAKRRRWSNVFRLSATLTEPVDVSILESALAVTVKRFPSIAVRIRKGVFWYYLEEIPKAPAIRQDLGYPLSRMPFSEIRQCAFRVLYYDKRIAVEIFHALTDGNGGLVFLKTLLAEYLFQKHQIAIQNINGVLDRAEEPSDQELEDSFLKYGSPVSASRKESDAYRLTGTPEKDRFLNLITGVIEVSDIVQVAKSHHVSMTEFLTAVMIVSIVDIQNEKQPNRNKQKPVKVLIPVNLRKIFDSTSLRNFALYITPGINPRLGVYSFKEVLKIVHHQIGVELNDKHMASRITTNVNAEKSWILKIMPLFIKNLAMKIVYNRVGEKKSCLPISNLGEITLPPEMSDYVDRFDFMLGAPATRPNNCGMLSYKGVLYVNFIRNIQEPMLEHKFFTYLRKLGIRIRIESNQRG